MVSKAIGLSMRVDKGDLSLENVIRSSERRRIVAMIGIVDALRNDDVPHGLHISSYEPVINYLDAYMQTRARVDGLKGSIRKITEETSEALQFVHLFAGLGVHVIKSSVRE